MVIKFNMEAVIRPTIDGVCAPPPPQSNFIGRVSMLILTALVLDE